MNQNLTMICCFYIYNVLLGKCKIRWMCGVLTGRHSTHLLIFNGWHAWVLVFFFKCWIIYINGRNSEIYFLSSWSWRFWVRPICFLDIFIQDCCYSIYWLQFHLILWCPLSTQKGRDTIAISNDWYIVITKQLYIGILFLNISCLNIWQCGNI